MANPKATKHRMQILAAAQNLFLSDSYESISESDISASANVAEAVFYEHFVSKKAVLAGLVDELIFQMADLFRPIVDHPTLSSTQKLNEVFRVHYDMFDMDMDPIWAVATAFFDPDNFSLHRQMDARRDELIIPLLAKIVEQGRTEGVFDVPEAMYSAEFVLTIIQAAQDAFVSVLLDTERAENSHLLIISKYDAAQSALERILQAPANSIKLSDHSAILRWFA